MNVMKFEIDDVYNETDSELTVNNKIGDLNEVIPSKGRRENIDTHINDLVFKVQSRRPIVFNFIHNHNKGADDHLDVEVGHPENA